jgi:hypothetical protein
MPYLVFPLTIFLTVLLTGGIALIADGGRRLLRGERK